MPNISVVTPAHITNGDEKVWLQECIESVRVQTVPCEHVVWNDASPMELEDFRGTYPHLVWRSWDERKGCCWSRNAAIATARGPLILPLDADDKLEPQAAERLHIAWVHEGPHCFTYGDLKLFSVGMEMDRTLPNYDFGLTLKTCLAPVTILYPKAAWAETGGYDPEFESGMEDWAFLIALGTKGYCGVHVNAPTLWYRSRPGSRRAMMRGHSNEIVQRIQEKFVSLYRGERPEGCCAGDGQVRVASVVRDSRLPPPVPQGAPSPVADRQVTLRYVGEKQGNFSVHIRPTRRFVNVSARYPILVAKPEEAEWLMRNRRDFART